MANYSSRQAAKLLGISGAVLSKYLLTGKIPPPRSEHSGGITVYFWTDQNIERVRQLLPKIANGRKTRQRKEQKPKKHTRPKKASSGKSVG